MSLGLIPDQQDVQESSAGQGVLSSLVTHHGLASGLFCRVALKSC